MKQTKPRKKHNKQQSNKQTNKKQPTNKQTTQTNQQNKTKISKFNEQIGCDNFPPIQVKCAFSVHFY